MPVDSTDNTLPTRLPQNAEALTLMLIITFSQRTIQGRIKSCIHWCLPNEWLLLTRLIHLAALLDMSQLLRRSTIAEKIKEQS